MTSPREQPRHVKERPAPKKGSSPVELSKQVLEDLKASAKPGKAEALQGYFADAVDAYAQGDFKAAARIAEGCKQLALRSPSVRELLGLTYYALGDWKGAARELAAFGRITGSTAQNHVLADCYRAMSRPDKAIAYCDEVVRGEVPDEVFYECQIVAAGAMADEDRVEDALTRLLRLELEPPVAKEHHLRAWYVVGDLLERKGRFTQARNWFEAVANADPELTDATERLEHLSAQP